MPRKIALVSHDYNVPDANGGWDYAEHFQAINARCDQEECDTILYALYTLDTGAPPRTHDGIFGPLLHVQTVVIETGDLDLAYEEGFQHCAVEVWRRGHAAPLVQHQRFAFSQSPEPEKLQFMAELPLRCVEGTLLVICGETNIASTVRGPPAGFADPHAFLDALDGLGCQVILNPIHDYMRRHEMREKRRRYSEGGRTVVSVWNMGRGGAEAHLPWTVYQSGVEVTDIVVELPTMFPERPDIRVGVLLVAEEG